MNRHKTKVINLTLISALLFPASLSEEYAVGNHTPLTTDNHTHTDHNITHSNKDLTIHSWAVTQLADTLSIYQALLKLSDNEKNLMEQSMVPLGDADDLAIWAEQEARNPISAHHEQNMLAYKNQAINHVSDTLKHIIFPHLYSAQDWQQIYHFDLKEHQPDADIKTAKAYTSYIKRTLNDYLASLNQLNRADQSGYAPDLDGLVETLNDAGEIDLFEPHISQLTHHKKAHTHNQHGTEKTLLTPTYIF